MIVHFTSRENLKKIENCGWIKPKKDLFPNPTGGNVDKIAGFKGLKIANNILVTKLKQIICDSKNNDPWVEAGTSARWSQEEFVGLVLETENIQWEDYPKGIKELVGQLTGDDFKEAGVYVKTKSWIPVSCIKGKI